MVSCNSVKEVEKKFEKRVKILEIANGEPLMDQVIKLSKSGTSQRVECTFAEQ